MCRNSVEQSIYEERNESIDKENSDGKVDQVQEEFEVLIQPWLAHKEIYKSYKPNFDIISTNILI